ncbi:hypothetical protein D3C84_348830 [compost metagenome]
MSQISVTRALAQIKSLDGRITKATSGAFVTYAVGTKTAGGSQIADVEVALRANLQSVKDMIVERSKLKSAVVQSNAVNTVTIAGVTMTVAQAIERKSSIAHEQRLLQAMSTQLRQATSAVEQTNLQVQVRLDKLIETAVGKDRKVDEAEISAITVPFRDANSAKLVDPANVQQQIDHLDADITAFQMEVDYALSEANATTLIDVA